MLTRTLQASHMLAAGAIGASGRRAIGRWCAVIQFDVEESSKIHLIVENQSLEVREGPHIRPTVVVSGPDEGLALALSGSLDFTHLFADGSTTVGGNYYDIINLGRVTIAVKRSGAERGTQEVIPTHGHVQR